MLKIERCCFIIARCITGTTTDADVYVEPDIVIVETTTETIALEDTPEPPDEYLNRVINPNRPTYYSKLIAL